MAPVDTVYVLSNGGGDGSAAILAAAIGAGVALLIAAGTGLLQYRVANRAARIAFFQPRVELFQLAAAVIAHGGSLMELKLRTDPHSIPDAANDVDRAVDDLKLRLLEIRFLFRDDVVECVDELIEAAEQLVDEYREARRFYLIPQNWMGPNAGAAEEVDAAVAAREAAFSRASASAEHAFEGYLSQDRSFGWRAPKRRPVDTSVDSEAEASGESANTAA